ncbi:MAG: CoA transferase [Clostridiales Family XIII bacterium]|jgi:crotonobetainyl-CoA:carnitine CoA-transferase CaiB-like acyl-CoA transferase|nr:CoA transferase [Clostridiales Family XIII bacterium]
MYKRPLEGVKILDLSQVLSAPFCGMLLADMGAQIIKVERPGGGDISRAYGPYINDISLYFCQYNRGKKGLAVDMRSEAGKRVIMDLVAGSDIVIENFKNGTLEKLGIGYEEMRKVNPKLIYGSISGFGTYGPLSHLPCMDIIAAARSGLVSQTGIDVPIKPGFSICDTWAGLHLARGLSMALLNRQRTGEGMRVDVAMLDCAFYMCETPVLAHSMTGNFEKRTGNHDPAFAPCGEFAASDGNAVIAVTREAEWHALCEALGLSRLIDDPRFRDNESRLRDRDSLTAEIEGVTASMGRHEIEEKLRGAGVPAAAVQTIAEFINDPRTRELDVVAEIDQPGVGGYTAVNTPIRFSKTPVNPSAEAPSFPGAHSVEVLAGLGYSRDKIDELLKGGAVHQSASERV